MLSLWNYNKQLYTFRAIINRINSRYTKKTTTNQNLTNPNPIRVIALLWRTNAIHQLLSIYIVIALFLKKKRDPKHTEALVRFENWPKFLNLRVRTITKKLKKIKNKYHNNSLLINTYCICIYIYKGRKNHLNDYIWYTANTLFMLQSCMKSLCFKCFSDILFCRKRYVFFTHNIHVLYIYI